MRAITTNLDLHRAISPVAVLDDSGKLTSVDPQDAPNPVVTVLEITWDDFRDFLEYGQSYE
jgi:hypothetical protein